MRAALDGMQGSARSMREHIHTIFDDDAVQEEPEGMTPRGIEPLQPRTTWQRRDGRQWRSVTALSRVSWTAQGRGGELG